MKFNRRSHGTSLLVPCIVLVRDVFGKSILRGMGYGAGIPNRA